LLEVKVAHCSLELLQKSIAEGDLFDHKREIFSKIYLCNFGMQDKGLYNIDEFGEGYTLLDDGIKRLGEALKLLALDGIDNMGLLSNDNSGSHEILHIIGLLIEVMKYLSEFSIVLLRLGGCFAVKIVLH
jgi:hypothetical protein